MSRNQILLTSALVGLFGIGCASTPPVAPVQEAQRPALSTTAKTPEMNQMTPEMMQEAFKKAGTPGQEHAMLKMYVGTWNTVAKEYMPGSPEPRLTKGVAVLKPVLGGRQIEQVYTAVDKGEKFEGRGMLGYDNVAKKYVSTWVDTMITAQLRDEGVYDAAAKKLVFAGKVNCPVSGDLMETRSVLSAVENNSFTYEMFVKDPSGKEMKAVEVVYTKKGVKAVKPVVK